MDEFNVDQLTKELVRTELSRMRDPGAASAALVKRTLEVALNGMKTERADRGKVIEDACRGGIIGLMQSRHDVAHGAVLILGAVCVLAAERGLDSAETMRSSLRGLADLARFLEPRALKEIKLTLESRYVGAGQYFADYAQRTLSAQPPGKAAVR